MEFNLQTTDVEIQLHRNSWSRTSEICSNIESSGHEQQVELQKLLAATKKWPQSVGFFCQACFAELVLSGALFASPRLTGCSRTSSSDVNAPETEIHITRSSDEAPSTSARQCPLQHRCCCFSGGPSVHSGTCYNHHSLPVRTRMSRRLIFKSFCERLCNLCCCGLGSSSQRSRHRALRLHPSTVCHVNYKLKS